MLTQEEQADALLSMQLERYFLWRTSSESGQSSSRDGGQP